MIRLPGSMRSLVAAALAMGLGCAVSPALADPGFAPRHLDAGVFEPGSPDFLPVDGTAVPAAEGDERPRLGLLDSRRFSFSHSLSYGFSTGSYGNASAGLWNTSLTYRVSDPLSIRADVGAWLNTSGEGSVLAPDHVFLRNLSLDYRLGESTRIHVSYQSAPPGASWGRSHDPFRSPGWVTP